MKRMKSFAADLGKEQVYCLCFAKQSENIMVMSAAKHKMIHIFFLKTLSKIATPQFLLLYKLTSAGTSADALVRTDVFSWIF